MEEKIIFKVKTHKFLPFVKIALALFLIILVVYYGQEIYLYTHYYDDHIHDSNCVGVVDEMDNLLFTEEDYQSKSNIYSTFHDYIEGEYEKNIGGYVSSEGFHCEIYTTCDVLEYGSIAEANRFFYMSYIDGWIISIAIFGSIMVVLYIVVGLISIQKCKFSVTENNIYGKKGSKKFDIAFKDIVEITQKDKSITIKTEKKKLKLSPLKNCDEIYNHIKPNVTEKPIMQQVTSTVDDIKLF